MFSPYAFALIGVFCLSFIFSLKKPTNNCGVKIDSRALTPAECTGYLGKDVTSGGYKAIQINLKNTTQRYLKLSQNDMDLKTVSADVAAQSVDKNISKRVLGWGIPSLFIPILLVPALITTTLSHRDNKKVLKRCKDRALSDRVIAPNDTFTGVIFVPISDYKDSFNLVLRDQKTQERIICGVKIA